MGNSFAVEETVSAEGNPEEMPSTQLFEKKFFDFTSSMKTIRLHSEDEDFFLTSENASGGKQLVNGNGTLFNRRIYNEKNLLSSIEYWKIGNDLKDSFMIRKENFFYEPDSEMVSSTVEDDFSENTESVHTYGENGKLLSFEVKKSDGENFTESTFVKFKYDGKERLIEESSSTFTHFPKKKLVTSSRTLYKYTKPDFPPDSSFYEDGVLRVRTFYQTKDSFIRTTYFDSDITVREIYEGSRKISSSVSNNGRRGALK